MDFYSDLTDADVVGDLLVEATRHHQCHHLPLTGGESLEARPQCGDCLFVFQKRAIACQTQLYRVQQVLIAERLGQELDCSSLYRLDGHRDVAVYGLPITDDRDCGCGLGGQFDNVCCRGRADCRRVYSRSIQSTNHHGPQLSRPDSRDDSTGDGRYSDFAISRMCVVWAWQRYSALA